MKKIFLLLILSGIGLVATTTAQSPKNLTLLGSLSFPGKTLAGCWHYNNSSGNEYAVVGTVDGIAIIDITNPVIPQLLFQLPGVNSLWHEVKVQGDFAYAVSEGFDPGGIKNGVQIIDLRFLPDSAPNKFYYGTGLIQNQLTDAHTVTTAGNYLYVNGHNISSLGQGVLIFDISDPWFPEYVGAITTRYCHDSYVRGDTIYTSDIRDGMFSVYDITDRANPVILATQITPGQFNHNTWLSDNGQVIYTTDERGSEPLAAYDITDLNNITLIDTFFNGKFSSDEVHNVRVINDYLINPSYGSQLTIVDAARPQNLIEVGNYETGVSLCWDADPYLNSGNIIATDMNSGMFYVFSPTYVRACYLEGIVTDSVTGLPIFNAIIQIQPVSITENSDAAGVYRTGYADAGVYNVTYTKIGYNPRQISVSLQNGVVTTLDVKLVPTGTGIQDLTADNISVFPNPVNDFLIVDPAGMNILNFEIKDECGRVIYSHDSKTNMNGRFVVDVNSLPSGFYTLELLSDVKKIVRKIIKQ